MSPHLSQPDVPRRCPLSVTRPRCCPTPRMRHIAAHLACATLLCASQLHDHVTAPLQLHTPHRHAPRRCPHTSPPRSRTRCVTMRLAATHVATPLPPAGATSLPPSQPRTSCHRAPRHCTGHVAPLMATHIVLLHASQPRGHIAAPIAAAHAVSLHGPRHPAPHRCAGHIAPLAATHIASPCTSQLHGYVAASHIAAPLQCWHLGPLGMVYTLCRTLYLFIIAGIYLLNPI